MNIMAGKYMVWPAEALHMNSKLTGKSKKRHIRACSNWFYAIFYAKFRGIFIAE